MKKLLIGFAIAATVGSSGLFGDCAIAQVPKDFCKKFQMTTAIKPDDSTIICLKNNTENEFYPETFQMFRFSASGKLVFAMYASLSISNGREAIITFKDFVTSPDESVQFILLDRKFHKWGEASKNAIAVNKFRSDIKLIMDTAENYRNTKLQEQF